MADNSYKSFRGNVAGLEAALAEGRTVRFKYRKTNGSVRYAVGRFPRSLREDMGTEGNLFRYWDVGTHDWRSFYIRNLL
jgi:hypothetical protein